MFAIRNGAARLMFVTILLMWYVTSDWKADAVLEDSHPYCTPETLPFRSVHVNTTKFLQGDGSFTLGYQHCRLRDFEGDSFDDIQHAMKGSHLLFFGDSLSRYTYMSLAYLLAYRRWTESYARDSTEGLSVCSQFQFHDWSKFFPWTNDKLNRLNSTATKESILRHPYVNYEICDCRRVPKRFPNEAYENRHFRLTPITSSLLSSLSTNEVVNGNETVHYRLDGDLDDTEQDIRLSYIQWFGKTPVKWHKQISDIPRSLQGFERHVAAFNEKFCPEKGATLYPFRDGCDRRRARAFDTIIEHSDLVSAFPAVNQPACSVNKTERLSPCHIFEEIFVTLNITHVLVNSGMWFALPLYDAHLLDNMVQAARLFLKPVVSVNGHRHHGKHHQLNQLEHLHEHPANHTAVKGLSSRPLHGWQLKPFIWRQTYAPSRPLIMYADDEAGQERQLITAYLQQERTAGRQDFDVFWGYELTQWFANMFHVRHTDGKSHQIGWQDIVLSVDYLRRKGLLAWLRTHPLAATYGAQTWTDVAASEEDAFRDKYRGVPAQSTLGKEIIDTHMNFTQDVGYIYEDDMHFAPYVYNEINKVFLSATVPMATSQDILKNMKSSQ